MQYFGTGEFVHYNERYHVIGQHHYVIEQRHCRSVQGHVTGASHVTGEDNTADHFDYHHISHIPVATLNMEVVWEALVFVCLETDM